MIAGPDILPSRAGLWKSTVLAGLANYIDSGSIVAGSVALSGWAEKYHLSDRFVGLIGAFSANAISAGVGALIGGWLCDRYGRKKIYQFDMLFYAFGMLWLVLAFHPWMIVVGSVLVGLAVGADIPASWSLIAELAPADARARHSGVAQLLWGLGPLVVLLLSLALQPLGELGLRLVFGHLMMLALLMTLTRSKMAESPHWLAARSTESGNIAAPPQRNSLMELMRPRYLKPLLFLTGMYGMWNLWAGTMGFYLPYILQTVGGQSQVMAVLLQAVSTAAVIAVTLGIFMPFADHFNQRVMYALGALSEIVGTSMVGFLPLNTSVAFLFIILTSFGFSQCFFQVWSAQLFPTPIRGSAQGLAIAVVRIGLGIWSFFVPILVASQFSTVAWTLTGFLIVSFLIGMFGAPRNPGAPLDES